MSTKPTYSRAEIKQREELLTKCFQACDFNNDGFLDPPELEIVARCFNAQANANVDQEVKVIISKLDKNGDGRVDLREWNAVLFDLFRFMNAAAFDKHCDELLQLIKTKANSDAHAE